MEFQLNEESICYGLKNSSICSSYVFISYLLVSDATRERHLSNKLLDHLSNKFTSSVLTS